MYAWVSLGLQQLRCSAAFRMYGNAKSYRPTDDPLCNMNANCQKIRKGQSKSRTIMIVDYRKFVATTFQCQCL